MKAMRINLERNRVAVTLEEADTVRNEQRALLHVAYPRVGIGGTWVGAYLTKRAAERMRDWLNEWIDKQEGER